MQGTKEIKILKLGGSLLTDKTKPYSVREEVIDKAINQIIESNVKLILIHGGGSFGHPLAKEFKISDGLNENVKNQILGLTLTHNSMITLNSILVTNLLNKRVPTVSIQSSSIFIKKGDSFEIVSTEIIEDFLDLGVLPVLYGDIILDNEGSFSIISGDKIIVELCKKIKNYKITEVIFAIDEDGLYIKEKRDGEVKNILAEDLKLEDLDHLELIAMEQKIDVTEGINGKIKNIKQICQCDIPVRLINGLKEGFILKALKNENILSTKINGLCTK